MHNDRPEDLSRQSLGRPLEGAEVSLAEALTEIFGSEQHDLTKAAEQLQALGVARPSGQTGPWTLAVLKDELKAVNASLDAAHEQGGITHLV